MLVGIVGDIKSAALENESRAPRDHAMNVLAGGWTFFQGGLRYVLLDLELSTILAAINVGRHFSLG